MIRFSPPEGIFAFATFGGQLFCDVATGFSPPEGIFAFATADFDWAAVKVSGNRGFQSP